MFPGLCSLPTSDDKTWPKNSAHYKRLYPPFLGQKLSNFRIFFIFLGLGEGKGEFGATRREGGRFLISNHGGGSPRRGWEGGEGGREGVCREFGGMGGEGGLNIFVSGAKCPPRSALQKSECCSATSAAQHSENCSATSVFTCGMLQG